MALTTIAPASWQLDARQHLTYSVQRIDDVLSLSLPIPDPGGSPDILGRQHGGSMRRAVVIDKNVMRLYGDRIGAYLERHGIEYRLIVIPGDEQAKEMRTVLRICSALDDFGIDRFREPIIGFVGGVGSDIFGLAASLYRRGIPRIEYASTLVGAIDACLAFKTAVDFNGHKNRLGTYRPPLRVVIDRRFFSTLDRRRLADGLAEALKIGIAINPRLFVRLEKYGHTVLDEGFQGLTAASNEAALEILDDSVYGILGELEPNPFEGNPARPAYLGHTWSLALEMAALRRARRTLWRWRRRPWLLHGEAVALDILLSAGLAVDADHLTPSEYGRIASAINALELPAWDSLLNDSDLLAASLADMTRHRGGRQLVPLPKGLGRVVFANDITPARITRAVTRQRALGGRALA